MKKNIFIYLLFFLSVLSGYNVKAQSFINAFAFHNNQYHEDTLIICEVDSIILSANTYLVKSDFNSGMLDSVWETNTSINFSNPCPPVNLPASGGICWFGSTSYLRKLTSKPLKMSGPNCTISWDMKYGANQNATNCEAPDLASEGVHLQWSIDNGATWTQIPGFDFAPAGSFGTPGYQNGSGGYWTPVPGNAATGPYYTWNHYQSTIPAIAITPATKFRFYQDIVSGNAYGHWGLDNIIIESVSNDYYIEWQVDGNYMCIGKNTFKHLPALGTHVYIVNAVNLLTGISGSDTMIVIVKPRPVNPVITVNNAVLSSSYLYGNQWYFNDIPLYGAVDSILNPFKNGNYVVVFKDSITGCTSDPSFPVFVNNVGINSINQFSEYRIIPNPACESFYIETDQKIQKLIIYDMIGKKLKTFSAIDGNTPFNISDLDESFYIIEFSINDINYISKLYKSQR